MTMTIGDSMRIRTGDVRNIDDTLSGTFAELDIRTYVLPQRIVLVDEDGDTRCVEETYALHTLQFDAIGRVESAVYTSDNGEQLSIRK